MSSCWSILGMASPRPKSFPESNKTRSHLQLLDFHVRDQESTYGYSEILFSCLGQRGPDFGHLSKSARDAGFEP